jgi:hypothetical protein
VFAAQADGGFRHARIDADLGEAGALLNSCTSLGTMKSMSGLRLPGREPSQCNPQQAQLPQQLRRFRRRQRDRPGAGLRSRGALNPQLRLGWVRHGGQSALRSPSVLIRGTPGCATRGSPPGLHW